MADPFLDVGDDRIIAHLQFARAVASRSIDPRCRGADRTRNRARARETLAEQLPPRDDREHKRANQYEVPCRSQSPLEWRLGPVPDRG